MLPTVLPQRRTRLIAAVSACALLIGWLGGVWAEDYEARIFSDGSGGTLNYRILKPESYDGSRKYPVILFLHGAGERGSDNQSQLKNVPELFVRAEVRAKYPCFVVVPQVPKEQYWNAEQPQKPLALAVSLLDSLAGEFNFDQDREYVTGLSMGGVGTWESITRWPERWAAAVPICGAGNRATVGRAAKIALWAFHGDADESVKVEKSREMVAALRAAGGNPLYSEYPGVGHPSWFNAYQEPELLAWLFAQKRGTPVAEFEKVAQAYAQPPSSMFPGQGPVQPAVGFRSNWQKQRNGWTTRVALDRGMVVLLGDSITQNWPSQELRGVRTVNRGINGDTTRGILYRLATDVLPLKPKAVCLLIGSNDLALGAEPALVAKNIALIVELLHKADPLMPLVLCKVMPRAIKPGQFPERIQELNLLLEQSFKSDRRVTFCDTWSIFADEQGSSKKEEFPDFLQPNAAGYAKWSKALKPIFDQLRLSVGNR